MIREFNRLDKTLAHWLRPLGILVAFFTISFVHLPLTAQTLVGDTWKESLKNKHGEIAVAFFEAPSYVKLKNNNEISGICIDIFRDFVEYVKRKKGVDLIIKFAFDRNNFTQMYLSVKNGESGVFGIGNIAIKPERRKEVQFTNPFLVSFNILVTNALIPTLPSKSELKNWQGFEAYCMPGTYPEELLKKMKKEYVSDLNIVRISKFDEISLKVDVKKKTVAYMELGQYVSALGKNLSIKRHSVADISAGLGFILPLNSDWSPIFNEFLQADGGYHRTERFKQILTTHLGKPGRNMMLKLLSDTDIN